MGQIDGNPNTKHNKARIIYRFHMYYIVECFVVFVFVFAVAVLFLFVFFQKHISLNLNSNDKFSKDLGRRS